MTTLRVILVPALELDPDAPDEGRTMLHCPPFRRLGSPPAPVTLTARAWFVRGAV